MITPKDQNDHALSAISKQDDIEEGQISSLDEAKLILHEHGIKPNPRSCGGASIASFSRCCARRMFCSISINRYAFLKDPLGITLIK